VNVLVTGGAGFIGSHLVRRLLDRGAAVRVLDDFSTGRRENLEEVEDCLEILKGDVRDLECCRRACSGVHAVLHQAALGSVPRSVKDPLTTHQVNVDGTLHLLVSARDSGVERFVFASSSSVYGDAPERVKVETLPPRPLSPYAVSKLAAEAYTCVFFQLYGLKALALRYFNVFGPRQDPESMYAAVVPRFATSLLAGRSPTIFGDGAQSRDFTYVDNVVDANLRALQCSESACGRAYNVACGRSTSVNDLFQLLKGLAGSAAARVEAVHTPPRAGDVRDSLASVEAAASALGYAQSVGVEEGLRRTMDWYREQAKLEHSR
jgi:nucleoside-diphosphate-sugar epimerase